MFGRKKKQDAPVENSVTLWAGRKLTDGQGLTVTTLPSDWWETFRFDGLKGTYGQIYRSQPNVRTVIDFLAAEVAGIKLKLYEKVPTSEAAPDSRIERGGHPLQRLLNNPNPRTTRTRLWKETIRDMHIYDVAYWKKLRSGSRVVGLSRIPPVNLNEVRDPLTNQIVGYTDRNSQPVGDLVIFQGYDPELSQGQVSPLETLRKVLAEEAAATLHRQGMWRNGARREGVVSRPIEAPKWSPEAREAWRADFESTMSGYQNAGRVGLLEDGMAWNPDSFNPREMEYLGGRQLTRKESSSAFRVDPRLVFAHDDPVTPEIRTAFYVDRLVPLLVELAEEVDRQLLPDFEPLDEDNFYFEFNIDQKLKGCLVAGTLVSTEHGPVPIEEVRPGDRVWAVDAGTLNLKEVQRAWQTGVQPTLTIRTRNRSIRATGNHPFLVRERARESYHLDSYRLVWRAAEELNKGDVIVIQAGVPDVGSDECPTRVVTEGFAELCGLLLGDGNIEYQRGRPSGFTIAHHEEATYIAHYQSVMVDEFRSIRLGGGNQRGGKEYLPVRLQKYRTRTRVSSMLAGEELEFLGLAGVAHTKGIPHWIFGLTAKLRAAVLRGFLDADGTVNKAGYIYFTSCNRTMLAQVRDLAIGLGVPCSNLSHSKAQALLPSGDRTEADQWSFGCFDAQINADVIGSWDERYLARWAQVQPKQKKTTYPYVHRIDRDDKPPEFCSVASIISITEEPEPVPVFDLTVEAAHNFIANNVVVHNSFEEQARIASAAVGGPFVLVNEMRARLNLPPIPGGDEIYIPLNSARGGGPQGSPQAPMQTPGQQPTQITPSPNGAASVNVYLNGVEAKQADLTPPKERLPQAPEAALRRRAEAADKYAQVLLRTFARQGRMITPIVRGMSKTATKATIDMVWGDTARWDAELAKDLQDLTETIVDENAKRAMAQLRRKAAYDPQRTRAYISKASTNEAHRINQKTKELVQDALADPSGDELEAVFSDQAGRSGSLGTTLGTGFINFARSEGGAQGGARTKTWIVTSRNSRHPEMNGEQVGLRDSFSNGQNYPGQFGDASESANCQCLLQLD